MLVHIKEIVLKAVKGKYAVGAFNVNNLEILQAVLRAAEQMRSPVIIQTTEGAIKYAGLKELVALIRAAANEVPVPVALHLDHGHDLKLIDRCLRVGYSSVMIDGSALPYKKNMTVTKRVIRLAHRRGVWVQGELGRLEGAEDWQKTGATEAFLTDPALAKDFVAKTRIDALAVAIGNYHGVSKLIKPRQLRLDLKRLSAIAKIVNVPLVLHGASGFADRQIKAAVARGICIVNIDSELRVSFVRAERKFLRQHAAEFDPRKVLTPAIVDMQRVVQKKMIVLGSAGKV